MPLDVKKLLYTAAYRPGEMERHLDPEYDSFIRFDPELGYTLKNHIFRDGMDNTLAEYTYHSHGGHRKIVNYPERPCRINTYGNSFTQCSQVSDGETWQEILAAHFREPIRNFGVGGYGVYQACRRALRTEVIPDLSAEYIVLNIWDDDHVRNIDSARWISVGWRHRDLPRGDVEDAYPIQGFPWAHIRFDLAKGEFVELPGLCKDEDDLRKLGDPDCFYETFKDDHVVHLYTLREGGDAPVDEAEALGEAFGVDVDLRDPKRRAGDALKLHLTYGLRSTMYLLDKMHAWAGEHGKKLMVLLSYGPRVAGEFLEKHERFDRELVEYLQSRGVPFMDSLGKKAAEYKAFNLPADAFLDRFYIPRAGAQVFDHYSPHGNFWFAFAIREELIDWLDPKPAPYQ